MPTDVAGLEQIAHFMQFDKLEVFQDRLLEHLHRVQHHYTQVIDQTPGITEPAQLKFTRGRLDSTNLATVQSLGFLDQTQTRATLERWAKPGLPALSSQQSRQLLLELAPTLLESLSRMPNPDASLAAFDEFIAALHVDARRLLSLLSVERPLLDLLAELVSVAPALTRQLAAEPRLLELVAESAAAANVLDARLIAARIAQHGWQASADDENAAVDAGRWFAEYTFKIGVSVLRHHTDWRDLGRTACRRR